MQKTKMESEEKYWWTEKDCRNCISYPCEFTERKSTKPRGCSCYIEREEQHFKVPMPQEGQKLNYGDDGELPPKSIF